MSQTGQEQPVKYFRSLSQLEKTAEFERFAEREFPLAASEFPEGVSRRRWMQLMGASLALAGATGCRYGREEIAAYVVRPEGQLPGIPNYFATNFEWAGRVVHALVTNMDGRPIKVDGNPQHPNFAKTQSADFTDNNEKFASAGSDVFTQASVLSLYDPDRLGHVLQRSGQTTTERTWDDFAKAAEEIARGLDGASGKGLAIIYESTRSPSLQRRLAEIKTKWPQAALVEYNSIDHSNRTAAIQAAGGRGEITYQLEAAAVIVDLDADLLGTDPLSVHYARQYAKGRTPKNAEMNRLYSVEARYSVTGASADFRLPLPAGQIGAFLSRLEAAVDAGIAGSVPLAGGETEYSDLDAKGKVDRAIEVIASDLVAHRGNSLVVVGSHQAPEIQQAALRLNAKLGNVGSTVIGLESTDELSNVEKVDLNAFATRAAAGEFTTALILAYNPLYTASLDVDVKAALAKVSNAIYLADYDDETAEFCQWVLPQAHPLESWGDVRGVDGTYSVCQPQILPLLSGRTAIEVLGMLAGVSAESSDQYIRATAGRVAGSDLTDRGWKETLHQGFLPGSAWRTSSLSLSTGGSLNASEIHPGSAENGSLEVVIYPSEAVYDGRLANNGWLQELPQPITKLVWDNAAIMSPGTARQLGVHQSEMVRLSKGDASIVMPVFIVPSHAEGSISVQLGYGRRRGGTVCYDAKANASVGQDVRGLRLTAKTWIIDGVKLSPTTRAYKLSTTQDHFAIDEMGLKEMAKRSPTLIREGTLEQFAANSRFAADHLHFKPESMWKEPEVRENHAWGMTVDLNKCTGCSACVIACQAENNVPIVGKDQVSRGREMHWLRIDRYYQCDFERTLNQTDTDRPFQNPVDAKIVAQPMLCMHCETAPCEQVCPVAATVHTEEGINAMAYNRCIGTRYCANNCPFKVRRFNYYNFNVKYGYHYGWTTDKRETVNTKLQSLVLNPDVTVRGRGVMEKCTYCIQRIQNGKIRARQTGDGRVHDGDIKTACQEACPTQAIVFGDLNDAESRVSQLQRDDRAYGMLEELNIKPRTRYLTRLRNVPKRLMTRDQLHPKSEHHEGVGTAGHETNAHDPQGHAEQHAEDKK